MKKNIIYVLILTVAIFSFSSKTLAASMKSGVEGKDDVTELKSGYESGLKNINISSANESIEIFGKSTCNSSTKICTYQYQGLEPGEGVEEFLKTAIKCSNGESNITYQFTGSGGVDYKGPYSGNEDVTAYWTDVYNISCVAQATGDNVVSIQPSNNGSNNNVNNNNNEDLANNQNNDQQYNSSTTEQSPETGVETYYIVLIFIAVVSYVFMKVVKKYNLFKNV